MIGTLQTIVGVVIHIFFFFMYMLVLRVGSTWANTPQSQACGHCEVWASEFSCGWLSAKGKSCQSLWTMQPSCAG